MTGRIVAAALPLLLALAEPIDALAQTVGGPVRSDSGPLSEHSTSVEAGSRPVHDYGRGVRDGNPNQLSGNPVRESVAGDVVSGPVSEASVGSVTSDRTLIDDPSIGTVAVGAVRKDEAAPLRALGGQPLTDLGALQQQLRAVQPLPADQPVDTTDVDSGSAEQEGTIGAPEGAADEGEPPAPESDQPEAHDAESATEPEAPATEDVSRGADTAAPPAADQDQPTPPAAE